MNRIITYLVAGFLFCFTYSTAQTVTFSMDNQTVDAGQQFCVPVKVAGFNQVGGFQYTISFDPSVLRLQSTSETPTTIRNINLPDMQAPPTQTTFGIPQSAMPPNIISNVPAGKVTVLWTDNTFTGVTRADGTTIFEVCFTVLQNPGVASTQISFSNNPLNSEVYDPNFAPLTFNSQPATITINGGGGGPTPFKLSISDQTVQQGQQVCVDVTADGFTDILIAQFSIQYDPAKLQIVSSGNYNLSGLTSENIKLPGDGNVPSGRVTFSWNDPGNNSVTIPNGTKIFQLCFNAIGTGTTTVSFVDTPTPIEVRNGAGEIQAFNSKSGTITINGTGGGNSDTFRMLIEDKTADAGTQVCVNVSVEGHNDIISWQYDLLFDPARLRFDSVRNLNPSLAGLADAFSSVQPGRLICGWGSSNGLGATVPDGTVLFQACFTVLASGGTASINFSDDRIPFEARKSNGDDVPFNSKNGLITINSTGGGGGQFKLSIADKTVQTGQQVCLDVTADNMVNILGISTSFSYDPAKLQFVSIQGQTLPNDVIFGLPNAAQQPTNPGTITLVWTDASLASVTRPNGSVLFQICFNAIGANGTTANVNFASSPTPIDVFDKDENPVTYNLKNGTVTIGQTVLSLGQAVVTNVNCFGGATGAIDLQVQGGTGNFTYRWSNNATTQDISNLPAGSYSVTVTDTGNSQTATGSYMVTQPAAALAVTPTVKNADCTSPNSGSISLAVTGGTGPYSYNWSGSLQDNVAAQNSLPVGNYSVTVSDSKGCSLSNSYEVGAPTPIQVSANVTEATAGASNGSIALNVSGGNTPYTYNWSNNRTTATINNLAAGQYCVTVTDNKSCTTNQCFNVPEQSIPLSIANEQVTAVTCAGLADGTISFQIQGGRVPYTIVFSDGPSLQSMDGNVSRNNLSGGQIMYSVTDGAGQRVIGDATIAEPTPIQMTGITVTHDTEESGCTGRISITLSGGSPDYLVQWNAPNTGTGTQIINLCEGTFVPTVRDSKGCVQTFPGVTVNTFKVSGQVTNAQCPQDGNGKVKLNIAGGGTPYTYSWRNANNEVISTADSLVNVAPGIYTVRVTEQSGNTLVRQFTIGSVSNLSAEVEVISDYNGFDLSCPNATDGIIEAIGRSGQGNYTYQWKRGDNILGNTSPVLNGAGAGTYEVIVTDGLGCKVATEIEVLPPDTIEINASIREISCVGNKDGEIIATAVGGAMGRPYTYLWGNGTSGPRLAFLSAGTYMVSVTDANNCTVSKSFTLDAPKPIQVQVQTEGASDGCNGTATAVVEGGTAPYTFQWNSFPNQNQQTINNLCPGPYFVRVTDSRGCSISEMVRGLVEDNRYPCIEASAVMTPNNDGGDGLNDRFLINCIENFPDNHLEVYNRWGQLVFEADNYDNNWGGTTQSGELLPEGPYYYVIEYIDVDGNLIQRKGSLTILRDN